MFMNMVQLCGGTLLVVAFAFVVIDYMSKTITQARKIAALEEKMAAMNARVALLEGMQQLREAANGKENEFGHY